MKKVSLANVILYGACALLLGAKTVFEAVDKVYADKPAFFILDVVCTVLWITCFVISFCRFRSGDKEE